MAYPFESSIRLTNAACQIVFASGNSYIEENPSGEINIFASSTNVMTLKSSGMALSTGAFVDTIETTLTDDDTHIPTSGAVFDAIGAISSVSVANQADNRVVTATGTTDALNAEAALLFNGQTLYVGGNGSGTVNAVIIDSASPSIDIHSNTYTRYEVKSANDSIAINNLVYYEKSGGTLASPTAAPSNAYIVQRVYEVYDGTSVVQGFQERYAVDGSISTGDYDFKLEWFIRDGASSPTIEMKFTKDGFEYLSDHSTAQASNDRWIPDKGYVDDAVGGISSISVANQADNRIITATATNDALNAETYLTWDGTSLDINGSGETSPLRTYRNNTAGNVGWAGFLKNDNDEWVQYGTVHASVDDGTDGAEYGKLIFYIMDDGSNWSHTVLDQYALSVSNYIGLYTAQRLIFNYDGAGGGNTYIRHNISGGDMVFYDANNTGGVTLSDLVSGSGDVSWGTANNNYIVFGSASGEIQSDSAFWLDVSSHVLHIDGGASDGGEIQLEYNNVTTLQFRATSATASQITFHSSLLLRSFQDNAYIAIGDTGDSNTWVTLSDPSTTTKTSILRVRSADLLVEWDFRDDGSFYITGLGDDDTEDHVLAIDDSTGLVTKRSVASLGGTSYWDRTTTLLTTATAGDDVALDAASKLYFDGGSDTYVHQPTEDVLSIVVGSTTQMTFYQGGAGDYAEINCGLQLNSLGSDDTEDHVVAIDDSTGLLSKRSVASLGGSSSPWQVNTNVITPAVSGDDVRLATTEQLQFVDANSYIYGSAANTIQIVTNSTVVATFNGSGDIVTGGSLYPATGDVEILGSSGSYWAEVFANKYSVDGYADIESASLQLTFKVNAGTVMVLNRGATPDVTISARLYFNDSNTQIYEDGSSNLTFTDAVTGTKTLAELAGGGSSPWTSDTNGITYSAGNVGIGEASNASYALTVDGGIRSKGANVAMYSSDALDLDTRLTFNVASGSLFTFYYYDEGDTQFEDMRIGSNTSNKGIYYDASLERVGINKDAPEYDLDVDGGMQVGSGSSVGTFYLDRSGATYPMYMQHNSTNWIFGQYTTQYMKFTSTYNYSSKEWLFGNTETFGSSIGDYRVQIADITTEDYPHLILLGNRTTDAAHGELSFLNQASTETSKRGVVIRASRDGNNTSSMLELFTIESTGPTFHKAQMNSIGNWGINGNASTATDINLKTYRSTGQIICEIGRSSAWTYNNAGNTLVTEGMIFRPSSYQTSDYCNFYTYINSYGGVQFRRGTSFSDLRVGYTQMLYYIGSTSSATLRYSWSSTQTWFYGSSQAYMYIDAATSNASIYLQAASTSDAAIYFRQDTSTRFIIGYDDTTNVFQIHSSPSFTTSLATVDFAVTTSGSLYAGNLSNIDQSTYLKHNTSSGLISYNTSSDLRLKTNIEEYQPDSLGWIVNQRLIKFDRKDGSCYGEIGWDGTQMSKIMPSLTFKDKKGYWNIKETKFPVHFHRAIQQLHAIDQGHEDRIGKLEKKVRTLRSEITALKKQLKS